MLPQHAFESVESGSTVGLNCIQEAWLCNIAHDLRSSLFAARGFTRMVLERRNEATLPVGEQHLTAVLDNLKAIHRLVEELSDFPKIAALNLARINVAELVQEASAGAQAAAAQRQIGLLLRMPHDSVFTFGDPQRLREALRIVFISAVDFTCRGGRLHVRLSEEEEKICISLDGNSPDRAAAALPDLSGAIRVFRLHGGAISSRRNLSDRYEVACELSSSRPWECM